MSSTKNHAADRAIGARIRLARLQARISQGALGERLGISFQQVQKYELGKDSVRAGALPHLAQVLGKDIAFFYEDAEQGQHVGPTLADIVDRRGRDRGDVAHDVRILRNLARIGNGTVKAKLSALIGALASAEAPAEVTQLQAAE